VDGRRFPIFEHPEQGNQAPFEYLRSRAGNSVTLTLQRADGTIVDVAVTLRPPDQAATQGALGISFNRVALTDLQRGPLDAVVVGFQRTIEASTLILRGIGQFLTNLDDPQVQGPVGMVTTVGLVRTELPPVFFVWLVAVLSANLAVVNALPFPPMDGGRVAITLLKRATGNRITPALERSVYLAGFVALMALLAWVTFFDIQRLGGG
jgi:regulator of sigma E protease